jgi:adenosine deaminase
MAAAKGADIRGVFDERGDYRTGTFEQFLKVYEAATSVLTSPEDYRRLTLAVLEQSAENGVVYSETFLSPEFCGGGDVGAWREYLAALEEAAGEAERTLGVTLRGIVTAIRHFGPDRARATALCAAETVGGFVTGFGLAGGGDDGAAGGFRLELRLRAGGGAAADLPRGRVGRGPTWWRTRCGT